MNIPLYASASELPRFSTLGVVPEEDRTAIKAAYSSLPHEALKWSEEDFLHYLAFRIYTEWCMAPCEGWHNWDAHRFYDGKAFKDFVDAETHYALERMGHTASRIPKGDKYPEKYDIITQFSDLTADEYTHVRKQVLTGLAKKAIEFFIKDEAKALGKENLRGPLESYLN